MIEAKEDGKHGALSGYIQLTEYEPEGGVGEDDPDGHLGGGLPPGVADEPDVGHDHQHEHDGVEGEDGGDALPVGQQGPALRHLAVLGRLVVDHAHDHQQEARSNLHTRHASYVWLCFAIQYTEKEGFFSL